MRRGLKQIYMYLMVNDDDDDYVVVVYDDNDVSLSW